MNCFQKQSEGQRCTPAALFQLPDAEEGIWTLRSAGAYPQSLSPAMLLCSKMSCFAAKDTDGGAGPACARSFIRALSSAASLSTSPPRKSGGPPSLLTACAATSLGPGFSTLRQGKGQAEIHLVPAGMQHR